LEVCSHRRAFKPVGGAFLYYYGLVDVVRVIPKKRNNFIMASPTSPSNVAHHQPQPQQISPNSKNPRRRSGSESVDASTKPVIDPTSNSKSMDFRMDDEEYEIRKRLPPRFPSRKNDVYVTRRTNFKSQLARCEKLLDTGFDSIFVHGLGAAVNRAINLSLQLKRRGLGSLDVAVNTSTVEVTDDLEPLLDELESQTRVRNCSAVHIKIFRPDLPVADY